MTDPKKPRRSITPARLYREVSRVVEAHGLQKLDTIARLLEELVDDVLTDAIGDDND